MRTGGGIDDRTVAFFFELVAIPIGGFAAAMLSKRDLVRFRIGRQRLLHRLVVELKLDHFPIAFMEIVEAIENVIKPILKREPIDARFGGDMGVNHRLPIAHPRSEKSLVTTTAVERSARQIEIVVVVFAGEIGRGRRGSDDRISARFFGGGSFAQKHLGIAQHDLNPARAHTVRPWRRTARIGF